MSVLVFWFATRCGFVSKYQCFRRTHCLQPQISYYKQTEWQSWSNKVVYLVSKMYLSCEIMTKKTYEQSLKKPWMKRKIKWNLTSWCQTYHILHWTDFNKVITFHLNDTLDLILKKYNTLKEQMSGSVWHSPVSEITYHCVLHSKFWICTIIKEKPKEHHQTWRLKKQNLSLPDT
jgi:hypothetical protein